MTGIGYTKKATTYSQPANKPNSTKAQSKSSIPSEAKHVKVVSSCHHCGIKGHIMLTPHLDFDDNQTL